MKSDEFKLDRNVSREGEGEWITHTIVAPVQTWRFPSMHNRAEMLAHVESAFKLHQMLPPYNFDLEAMAGAFVCLLLDFTRSLNFEKACEFLRASPRVDVEGELKEADGKKGFVVTFRRYVRDPQPDAIL